MRITITGVVLVSMLLAACGGSSSGGSAPEARNLDRFSDDVQRESRTLDVDRPGYQATIDFYHFTEQQAVLVARFPNDSRDFSMAASVVLFDTEASTDAIRRWINSESSGTSDPRAARPQETVELQSGDDFEPLDSLYSDSVARSTGALYEQYQLQYAFHNVEEPGLFNLSEFTNFTTVYLWVNDFADIVNQALPIEENFSADSSAEFFSPGYKDLRTRYARFAPSLDDELPAFYYPLCCFDEIANDGRPAVDDDRLSVSDNSLRIQDAHFTIGQTQHLYRSDSTPNPKVDSTLYHYAQSDLSSWGELDLSEPYRISFCVRDASNDGELTLWADNNAGDDIRNKPFSTASRLLRLDTDLLIDGERLTVNVPGDILVGSQTVTPQSNAAGTEKSFLQLRVDQGGSVTISDLVIEYQDENNAEGLDCTAD